MNSKEALREIITNTLKYLPSEIINKNSELSNIVLKDLDRLEKLEKFVDIYKYTNQRFTMLVQAPYTDLPHPTLEQELLRVEVLEK